MAGGMTGLRHSTFPGPQDLADRIGHGRRYSWVQKVAPAQMPNRGLNRGLRQSGLRRNGLQADRQGVPSPFCCVAQEIKIYEEGRGPPIMSHQIGHEHIDDVIVQIEVLHL